MHCIITEDTSELLARVNPLVHFNAEWHKNQLVLGIYQLPKIVYNAGKAFTSPMHELINKYDDVFTKPEKPVAGDIKYKIELLDPAKPITHHKLQKNI